MSIEDERFYKHHGVDFKRTAAATFTYALHSGSSNFGGSTITQQLVKNLTNDKDRSGLAGIFRKVKEMSTGKLFSICTRNREWGLCDVEDYSNIPSYYGHSCKDEGIDNYLEFIKENPLTIQPRTDFDVSETPIFGLNDSEAIKELCNKKEEFSDYVEDDDLRRRFIATMEELSKRYLRRHVRL